MSRRDHANAVLAAFGAEIGLGPVALGPDGRLSLNFNDLLVTVRHCDEPVETLWFMAEIGRIPDEGTTAAQALLELNLQTALRNVMTICLAKDGTTVVGHTALPVALLSLARLKAVLGPLVENALTISEALRAADFAQAQPARAAPADAFRV
jgi:Tir chaperone protein (CesT) family